MNKLLHWSLVNMWELNVIIFIDPSDQASNSAIMEGLEYNSMQGIEEFKV